MYFLNIDGNASNFDQFIAELQLLNHQFPVIALAETNIEECNKNLYQIDGYRSIYQSNIYNQSTGKTSIKAAA